MPKSRRSTATPPPPETPGVVDVGKVIAQTNQLYVQIGAIGHLNARGKSIFSSHYKGKLVAKPDRPLSTLGAAVLTLLSEHARYSDPEQAKQDIDALKTWVNGLEWVAHPPQPEEPADDSG